MGFTVFSMLNLINDIQIIRRIAKYSTFDRCWYNIINRHVNPTLQERQPQLVILWDN